MNHNSTIGAVPRVRCMSLALFLFGLLAFAGMFTPPANADDDFPWAQRVVVAGPNYQDYLTPNGSSLYTVDTKSFMENPPKWVNDVVRDYDDPDPCNSVDIKAFNLMQMMAYFKRNPVFTSDGKSIIFNDRVNAAWMVPAEGGEPNLVGDWYPRLVRNKKGEIIGGSFGIWYTCGLSPDDKEVVGVLRYVKEGAAVLDTLYDSNGNNIGGSILTYATKIVSRNIETHEERIISDDAFQGHWSHDGRFFVYVKRDPNLFYDPGTWDNFNAWENMITGMYVKNMTTGQEWKIAPLATGPFFTPDDSAVICSMKDANGIWQIFSIPREGGTPVQISFFGANDNGRNARVTDVSQNGQWILYTGDFTSGFDTRTGLCVFNTSTGKTYPLFPEAACMTGEGSFSPDGKKIVFTVSVPFYEKGVRYGDAYAIYTADFDPDAILKTTGVADALPAGFAIAGNYPNPFNPSTTIRFTVPASGNTQLDVYDVTGRKVRELFNGPIAPGSHSMIWDGRDASGKQAASGVYLSRLTWNGKSTANRMLLAK